MSIASKTTLHRSSLGESSAEDLNNAMWRNELPHNDDVLPEMELSEEQELSPVPGSKKRFINVVDVVLRVVIVLVFL